MDMIPEKAKEEKRDFPQRPLCAVLWSLSDHFDSITGLEAWEKVSVMQRNEDVLSQLSIYRL